MAKVGRFITDPKAGAYCEVVLDSGEKVIVNHDKGGFKGGMVAVETKKWWGGGQPVLACNLDSAEGKALVGKLTAGAAPGSADATPLGAFVNLVKDAKSVDDIRTRWATLQGSP